MPLSKERNRKRMRLSRLHKAISPPQTSKAVQPYFPSTSPDFTGNHVLDWGCSSPEVDADGNPIYEEE